MSHDRISADCRRHLPPAVGLEFTWENAGRLHRLTPA